MSVVLHTALHGDPVPKPRPRATVRQRRDGTPYATIYTPRQGKTDWRTIEDALGMQARAAGVKRPETEPLEVRLLFYTATAVRGDIDNLTKTVLDALNDVVWKDDKQIVALYVKVTERDPNPRVEIFVRHAEGSQTQLDVAV